MKVIIQMLNKKVVLLLFHPISEDDPLNRYLPLDDAALEYPVSNICHASSMGHRTMCVWKPLLNDRLWGHFLHVAKEFTAFNLLRWIPHSPSLRFEKLKACRRGEGVNWTAFNIKKYIGKNILKRVTDDFCEMVEFFLRIECINMKVLTSAFKLCSSFNLFFVF